MFRYIGTGSASTQRLNEVKGCLCRRTIPKVSNVHNPEVTELAVDYAKALGYMSGVLYEIYVRGRMESWYLSDLSVEALEGDEHDEAQAMWELAHGI